MGYSPWGRSDTAERLTHTHTHRRKEGTASILLLFVIGVVAR